MRIGIVCAVGIVAGCAAPEPQVLSATGYAPVRLDVDVDPGRVSAVHVAGVPAYDLAAVDGQLAFVVQGGPPGEHDVVGLVDGEELPLGRVVYEAPADPVFQRFAVVGASISQGVQDGMPTPRAQLASPGLQVARAVGAWLPLPLFRDGLFEPIPREDVGPAPTCAMPDVVPALVEGLLAGVTACSVDGAVDFRCARVSPDLPVGNFAIGNYRLRHQLEAAPADNPSYNLLTYFTLENTGTRFGDPLGAPLLERLEAYDPTVIVSFDVYGNDVLQSALEVPVDFDLVTPEEAFRTQLTEVLDRLQATGAEVFLGNLPRIDLLARTTTSDADPEALAEVAAIGDRYNAILDALAAERSRIHVVDQAAEIQARLSGLDVAGQRVDLSPLGGITTYDGVHFSDIGNALAADLMLARMEEVLGLTLSRTDLEAIVAASPHAPEAHRAAGREPDDCQGRTGL